MSRPDLDAWEQNEGYVSVEDLRKFIAYARQLEAGHFLDEGEKGHMRERIHELEEALRPFGEAAAERDAFRKRHPQLTYARGWTSLKIRVTEAHIENAARALAKGG